MLPCILLLCFSVSLVSAGCIRRDSGELVLVSLVFRHGDRNPIDTYPNDPYPVTNRTIWPEGPGQLINRGKQRHYQLGQWLRERYNDFLPAKYFPSDIYVRSTDVDRTLMSAAVILAGLYPAGDDNWSVDIPWQPVPVHTVPKKLDHLVAGKKPCLKYDRLKQELARSEFFTDFNRRYQRVYHYIGMHSGLNVTNVDDTIDTQDAFLVQELKGLPLPEWSHAVYPQPINMFVDRWLEIPCYTPEMARLKIGPLLKEVLLHMESKSEGSLSQKLWMYSGHDSTIANILRSLNIFDTHLPHYGSLIMIELRRKGAEHLVEIHYKNSTADPQLLKLPGCTQSCPLSEFRGIVEPLLPLNWEAECQL